MKQVNRPYFHESISQIIVIKDKLEISNWTETVELINNELQYLIPLEKCLLGNPAVNQSLLAIKRDNQLRLGTLYRYERTMINAIECDTTECDAYYLNTHEKNRDGSMDHIKTYTKIRTILLSKILERYQR